MLTPLLSGDSCNCPGGGGGGLVADAAGVVSSGKSPLIEALDEMLSDGSAEVTKGSASGCSSPPTVVGGPWSYSSRVRDG
jgi:hypothetical protein